MKRNFFISLFFVFIIFLSACEDNFLDRSVRTQRTQDDILYQGAGNLTANGMAAYSYLRQWTEYPGNAMLAGACDEADMVNKGTAIQLFNTGGWSQFSNPDEVMAHYYRGIAQTFNFLRNSEDFVNLLAIDTLNPTSKTAYLRACDNIYKLRAENRFLRAYFYFELVKRYGGVPILDKPVSPEETNLPPRNTIEECIQYIIQECDSAYHNMVDYWVNYDIPDGPNSIIGTGRGDVGTSTDLSKLGRAEKVAVKAFKLRVLLYAASPLFNPTGSIAKWEAAAAAGQDFLTDPDLGWWRHLYSNYGTLFYMRDQQLLTSRKGSNSGIIFTVPSTIGGLQSTSFEQWNYPVGITNGGKNVTAPSQNLVDAYEMQTTGLPISDALSGYNPDNPYTNRDPRLKLSIGINGELFGKSVGGQNRIIQSFTGGADAIGAKDGATTTGYYLRKMVNPDFDLSTAAGAKRSFILMRYAEVLLNIAEAMNEAYGPLDKPAINGVPAIYSATQALNLVRNRAGMPPVTGLNQDQLRERIRNERRVELAFEEHRFFDVRRWKIAEVTENQPLRGMRVNSLNPPDNTSFSYTVFNVENRVFDASKMYLYPIPEGQVIINNWQQNPNW